jgi:hypothetical protein
MIEALCGIPAGTSLRPREDLVAAATCREVVFRDQIRHTADPPLRPASLIKRCCVPGLAANSLCSAALVTGLVLSTGLVRPLHATTNFDGTRDAADIKAERMAFVRAKVLPLLESRCFECHGPEHEPKGGLRLTSVASMLTGGDSGAAIEPGMPDNSLLIQAVRYESFEMPPRTRLPAEEVAILEQWIRDGAHWPEDLTAAAGPTEKVAFPLQERIAAHWAWKKIEPPPVPDTNDSDWPETDIDMFLFDKLHAAGLDPAPDADRRVILRRLYFDLIGLPPTVEQQDRFLNDPADTPTAIATLADQLLASPHFGERWGRHWLDLVRYAETLGHEFDYPIPHAWQYRDYVIRAINADVPYDQFVREHIAGDLIEKPRKHPTRGFNESIIGTGFWYLGEELHAPVDVKADEALRIDNQIDVFSKTFLGLTISCARCHDHKFDAITTEDYYGLSGFLQSSRRRVEWLDENDRIAARIANLKTLRDEAAALILADAKSIPPEEWASLLTTAMTERSGAGEDPRVAILRTALRDPKLTELTHPLSLFATLVQKPDTQSDAEAVSAWCELKARDVHERQALRPSGVDSTDPLSRCAFGSPSASDSTRTISVARLDSPALIGWRAYGEAFRHVTSGRAGEQPVPRDTLEDSSAARWLTRFPDSSVGRDDFDGWTSAALSHRLKGELHTPEFELTHPVIHILAAGSKARVRLVIDGYVMNEFSELLFTGARQPIDTDGQFRWIVLGGDVGRYLGHRAHLEFLDEGDGWFAVREIRFATASDTPRDIMTVCELNKRVVDPEAGRTEWIEQWAGELASRSEDPSTCADLRVLRTLLPLNVPDSSGSARNVVTAWHNATAEVPGAIPVTVICEGTGEDGHIFIRGSHKNPGPVASRRLLTALDQGRPLQQPEFSGRMELADRVLADSNPFPARVMVNRVWQHLFGRGIVASSDNFGVLGELPTHPELLDHLADEFRRDGWSVKRLIRRIVTSRAYRMSSRASDKMTALAVTADPQKKLLHCFPIRRLEGEVLRDAMLSVSGRLDPTLFGAPVPTYLTEFMQGRGRPGESGPLDGAGRRSIYLEVRRNFLNPLLLAFDTPRPASTVGRRSQSNVPAQALILLNNEFVHEQARTWAARLLRDKFVTPEGFIITAFQQVLAREPSQEEIDALKPLLSEPVDATTLADVCHVLLNHKEFVFLE